MKRGTLLCLLALSSCVAETEVTRLEEYSEDLPPAVGAPASFVVDEDRVEDGTREIGACPLSLTDPKGGVRLRLSESRRTERRGGDTTLVRAYGDYFVDPEGSYGMSPDQVLRVDCARHAPIGLTAD